MRILASDSFGTRSMATFIEGGSNFFIDPGAALGPKRYFKPPHPEEKERLEEHLKKIREYMGKTDIVIITHYHFDHFIPDEPELYKGKTLIVKHPEDNINWSQKKRSYKFLKSIEPKEVLYADGKEFNYGKTKIRFSEAVTHGASEKLGYVTEVCIHNKEKIIHTSDVQGPVTKEQTYFIIENNPDILFLDGPLTYMLGFRFSYEDLANADKNLQKIIRETDVKKIIIDHHFLRDLKWKERLEAFNTAEENNVRLMNAAEYNNFEADMLEARRKELYKDF